VGGEDGEKKEGRKGRVWKGERREGGKVGQWGRGRRGREWDAIKVELKIFFSSEQGRQ
jgi:hypothetical protein